MRKILFVYMIVFVVAISNKIYAFDSGWVLNLRADFSGSATLPRINDTDLASLGANYMKGMVGFVIGGEAEVGYIFALDKGALSGVGVFGNIGISEGYAGQISGSLVNDKQVDVFFNAFYTPVATFSAAAKMYLFKNRMAIGLGVGGKLIADPSPTYEFYATEAFDPEVGTMIITEEQMKKMNPTMASVKLFLEYNVPILDTLELVLGGYGRYNIYTPKYLTMPQKLMDAAQQNTGFDPSKPLKSFFLDSIDFGLSLGLGFKLG